MNPTILGLQPQGLGNQVPTLVTPKRLEYGLRMLGFPVLYLKGPEDTEVPTFWLKLYIIL